MKAAVYYETGGPEVFRYEDVPDPQCPPDGVLVDVRAISVEGGDTLHRAGGEMASRPHIVGYQCAGVIRQVGVQVHDRKAGQRVGRIVNVGSAGRDGIQPDAYSLRPGNKSLTGVFLGAELMLNHARVHGMIARHLDDLARGALRIVVDREFPLAEAAAAHAYIESRQAFGRVLLVP